MSTWHADGPPAEAIRFALYNTFSDATFVDGCGSTIGITVGSAEWAGEVRDAFEEQITARRLEGDHG